MVNLLCMVKDVSYSEEDLNFTLTSTIGNNLASRKKKKKNQIGFISTYSGILTSTIGNNLASKKKKKKIRLDLYPRTLVVLAMFKVKVDSQRVI